MLLSLQNVVYIDEQSELSAILSIPALQRRRLSALAKMVLHTAKTALQQIEVDYIVWTSCYGDEHTTSMIMHDIAQGEIPSPTQFSVSVHNAISGQYSILYQDNTPAISLSSQPQYCWQDALIEAYTYLKHHQKKNALIVYYDAPLPEIYDHSRIPTALKIDKMYAIGAIVSVDFEHFPANVQVQPSAYPCDLLQQQAQAFYDFWQSDKLSWQGQGWIFEKYSS